VSPNLPLNAAIAFAGALLLAIGLVVLLEYLDQTVKSDDELTERTGIVALGHIPYTPSPKGRGGDLVSLSDDSVSGEAYKKLRTNLLFTALESKQQVIVVTSAVPGEGKSRTAANLAAMLSEAGQKTVVIDADFRRPTLHRMFTRVRNVGLANLILQDLPERELITPVEKLPNLWLVTSGPHPPNPSELLGSARMRALLVRLSQSFSYVIIDTPPVNAVADALIVAAMADATLLVVEQGRTNYPALTHAKQSLDRVGAKVIGAVLNKLRVDRSGYYYNYYTYDYSPQTNASTPTSATPAR
jgi:capsular exopolysaccharide synthesis family protein